MQHHKRLTVVFHTPTRHAHQRGEVVAVPGINHTPGQCRTPVHHRHGCACEGSNRLLRALFGMYSSICSSVYPSLGLAGLESMSISYIYSSSSAKRNTAASSTRQATLKRTTCVMDTCTMSASRPCRAPQGRGLRIWRCLR